MIPRSFPVASLAVAVLAVLLLPSGVEGFSSALFQEAPTRQRTAPSKMDGVDIELPDFDELFERIQQVSPLARSVITGSGATSADAKKGFQAIDDAWPENLKWKTVESKPKRSLHKIEKIDNFQGLPAPMLRFRSSLNGPCVGDCFGNFIMDLEQRKKWDAQIENVYEIYPIHDVDAANIAMGFGRRFGDCNRLGIGYCQTKASLGVSPREQLTLCGVQDFADGSCVIWGIELEEWHNHLLPPGPRVTRAKSHLFSTTMTPTSDNTFDVEYCLQLEIGGKIPTWLTAPILIDSVKNLFRTAESFFDDADDAADGVGSYLKLKEQHDAFADRHSLLMTP